MGLMSFQEHKTGKIKHHYCRHTLQTQPPPAHNTHTLDINAPCWLIFTIMDTSFQVLRQLRMFVHVS